MSERLIAMSAEQALILEELGEEMLRLQDDRAMKVLALSLAYKFAKPTFPENVYPIGYSQKVFACNPDESGGIA